MGIGEIKVAITGPLRFASRVLSFPGKMREGDYHVHITKALY